VPINIQTYSLVDIVKAVKVGRNFFEFGILCNKSRSKIFALEEIRVCLETDGVLHRDWLEVNCKSIIALPS